MRALLFVGFLWQRQFGDQLSLYGRDVTRRVARQRFRLRLWHILLGEIHRPGRHGGDHRRLELRQPKGYARGIVPGFNYFAVWYVLAPAAYLMMGIETRGRTIEELDAAFARPKPIAARPGHGGWRCVIDALLGRRTATLPRS